MRGAQQERMLDSVCLLILCLFYADTPYDVTVFLRDYMPTPVDADGRFRRRRCRLPKAP